VTDVSYQHGTRTLGQTPVKYSNDFRQKSTVESIKTQKQLDVSAKQILISFASQFFPSIV
jgi:hypothetical protein